jgi:hypothetical protein
MTDPTFTAGLNIAMKIPRQHYEATVSFYRHTLRFAVEEQESTGAATVSRTHKVSFGPNTLWLDCVDNYSQPDLWLELHTDDLDVATQALHAVGTPTCDEVEPLTHPAAEATGSETRRDSSTSSPRYAATDRRPPA